MTVKRDLGTTCSIQTGVCNEQFRLVDKPDDVCVCETL